MTTRPSWPPEVEAAYARGACVSWSPVRGRWVVDGAPVVATEQMSEEIGRLEPERKSARGENGDATRSRVAAALEAGRVRPVVARRAPLAPDRCPRCGSGSVVRATDEYGGCDDHCMSCSYRMDTPSPEALAALVAARNDPDGRERYREATTPVYRSPDASLPKGGGS